jgi:hypothetical protein
VLVLMQLAAYVTVLPAGGRLAPESSSKFDCD